MLMSIFSRKEVREVHKLQAEIRKEQEEKIQKIQERKKLMDITLKENEVQKQLKLEAARKDAV